MHYLCKLIVKNERNEKDSHCADDAGRHGVASTDTDQCRRSVPSLNNAVFGLAWREVLNDNANTEEYVYDKDIIVETPNGEQRLLIYTWCMDYDEKLYNIINGGFWALDISQTRSQTPTSANGQGFLTITKREYDELKQKIKSKTKIINVSK